ncbi:MULTISPECIES: lactonase family protein [unclassified Beijerinckia]|uniref:lactonase family protein n=1 Tax=unclassified Beijerinckia TaxID=2638183 RepID=UPI0008970275|nr:MULTISPECIES: lactonase family protein [unclassified Beijerinckia]MDH7798831.1 6-phosphogluconolactonase [Beijerinckia sp. GAS462]SED89504.1 6-phosphogluconolactonase, cycloisomerase 2 family [Beijerinckia sp. 28-YEA-48]
MWRRFVLWGGCLALLGTGGNAWAEDNAPVANRTAVFVGTQGSGPGQGIHAALLDETSGELTGGELAAEAERPTWLEIDPQRPLLYAVSEVGNDGKSEGSVASFVIEQPGGRLRALNRVGSGGGGATHLAYDAKGAALIVANFGGGQVSALPVLPDGKLEPVSSVQTNTGSGPHRRQTSPHAHGVALDPSERFVLAADMGADRVFVYRWDRANKTLSPGSMPFAAFPPGSGPRHLSFSRDGRFAFVLSELSSEIFTLAWNAASGHLTEQTRIALDAPDYAGGKGASEIVLSRDGRFLYALNRGQSAIQAYAVDPASGALALLQTLPSGGQIPWHARITPSGKWMIVANQGSGTLTLFAIDAGSGKLSASPHSLAIAKPANVAFFPPR